MALLKIWQASRAIMRLLVIQFVCWLGWFSTFALAQSEISEGVTGSITFSALGVTCVANLAVFVTTLIRGRLDLEMGARDFIEILLSPKLEEISGIKHGYGLTTCRQGNATETATSGGGGDVGAASTGENDVQSSASTEENVQSSPTEGGLQTISTEERAVYIGSTGHIGSTEQKEYGLKTAAVIILSNGTTNWSMLQFIKSNAHVVDSIILQFLPIYPAIIDPKVREELTAGDVTVGTCECRKFFCECIVFWTVEQVTSMLARRMPGTLKPLTDSLCLLPCSTCLTNGCHGCNRESLLREEGLANERQSVVSDILQGICYTRSELLDICQGIYHRCICICIPMNDVRRDDWSKLLVRSLRSKDAEDRGARNMASEALEGYLAGGRGSEEGSVEYDIFSFVVPRLTEVLINLVLTFWFKVDGFSSALVARRTVRNYLVDSKSSGFAANAFLTKAVIKFNGDNSQVCQLLTFRGRDRRCIITFKSVGVVNGICALGWALLISFEGEPHPSQPPSLPRVAVIMAAIALPWVMLAATATVMVDISHMSFLEWFLLDIPIPPTFVRFSEPLHRFVVRFFVEPLHRFVVRRFVSLFVLGQRNGQFVSLFVPSQRNGRTFVSVPAIFFLANFVFVAMSPYIFPAALLIITFRSQFDEPPLIVTGLLFEMACLLSLSGLAIMSAMGIKVFGRWLYGALQILIWVKWATGSHLLNKEHSSEFFGKLPDRTLLKVYSSAFWLNAVLAGVRCKWEAWPWKHNHLFRFVSE